MGRLKNQDDVDRDWDAKVLFDSVMYFAQRGFHASAIAKATGLSENQVRYRLSRAGQSTRAYRNGVGEQARLVLSKSPCVQQEVRAVRSMIYVVAPFAQKINANS